MKDDNNPYGVPKYSPDASIPIQKGAGQARVLIAIPNLGSIHTLLMRNIVQWMTQKTEGIDEIHLYTPMNIRPHDAARNTVVNHFMEKTNCTHLLFIDADTIPPLNALELLVAADKHVISGCTPTMKVDQYTGESKTQFMIMRYGKDIHGSEGLITVWGEGVEQIDMTGTSCLMIKREVLESVPKPAFKFQYSADGLISRGEDIHFCDLLKHSNIPLFAHFDVVCRHSKDILL